MGPKSTDPFGPDSPYKSLYFIMTTVGDLQQLIEGKDKELEIGIVLDELHIVGGSISYSTRFGIKEPQGEPVNVDSATPVAAEAIVEPVEEVKGE